MIKNLNKANFNSLETDVAIIGSGVSGLYSGWRLKNSSNFADKNVVIFEMKNRIGGRLFSVRNYPKMENIVGELGGMRYMEHQRIITNLIEKVFDLKTKDFPMGDSEKNIMYLRGQRFNESKFSTKDFITNYNLPEHLQGKHPDEIFTKIVNDILIHNNLQPGSKNRKEWDKIKNKLVHYKGPDKGHKLRDTGFWNLINDIIGNEGYNYISDAGAYFSNTINWNASEAMPYIIGDFTGDINYKTIEDGFDKISESLANSFINANGRIYTESKLINFSKSSNAKYKYELTIRNTENQLDNKVLCNKIILAMPRRSLELLNKDNILFQNGRNKNFIYNMRSVIGEPSFKLLMGFEPEENGNSWWKNNFNIDNGRSVTDLPMRQCYYFGTDPVTKSSLLLASYNDMRTVDYWKPLEIPDSGKEYLKNSKSFHDKRENEKFSPKFSNFFTKEDFDRVEPEYKEAPERMVNHSLAQLKELHGLKEIPQPFTTIYENWNDDPFGGGYHAWKARYDVSYVMKFMRQPVDGENVHICGEAYSDQQGWVEGALCVAENLLQQQFNLSPPEWLDKDYYLGR